MAPSQGSHIVKLFLLGALASPSSHSSEPRSGNSSVDASSRVQLYPLRFPYTELTLRQ